MHILTDILILVLVFKIHPLEILFGFCLEKIIEFRYY